MMLANVIDVCFFSAHYLRTSYVPDIIQAAVNAAAAFATIKSMLDMIPEKSQHLL